MARIWVDVESTGLDPEHDHLLELAVVATEETAPGYVEIASQSWVIKPAGWDAAAWSQTVDPHVLEMHTKSGLWAEVADGVTLEDAERYLCKFLKFFGNPKPGAAPIGGSSAHFDARFLEYHMPTARRYFNHRCMDASSIRQFLRDLGVDLPRSDDPAHRALADVRHSIQVCRDAGRYFNRALLV